jgi:DNA-binding response OmpR family regulator
MSRETPAILLLEADIATRELYERELGRCYRVYGCGAEADLFELLATVDICAIVMEPAVADGAGWRIAERLRDAAPALCLVLCSTLDERRRGMSLGAAAYLVKPILPTTLLETLQQVLGG